MKIEIVKRHKPIHQIFEYFKDIPNAVFLDSSLEGDLGKFSIVGLYPYLSISKQNGETKINGEISTQSFEDVLKNYLRENREENTTSLPIISGAIGYFSYDYGLETYGISSRHKRQLDAPDALLFFYDVFIIEDLQSSVLYIVANGKLKSCDESIKEIKEFLEKDFESAEIELHIDAKEILPDFERNEYMNAVEEMKQHIVEGDIYVVNMTEQFRLYSDKPPYEVFKSLRQLSPSPFGAYMNYQDFQIICSSPERFLKVAGGEIMTCPIKGTRKRGETKEEDERLKKELECSEKERSELLMVVDLERNDLNKICKAGSVEVENLFSVEEYAQVFHLVAKVLGELKTNIDFVDILSAMFPGGSITGTPKLSAMKIIDHVEKSRRNLYTGAIGYIALDGSVDLNIVIRTAIHQNGAYHVGAGGGITYESDSEFEMEEVFQKAKAVFYSIMN